MKTQRRRLIGFSLVLCVLACGTAFRCWAQVPPTLSVQINASRPTLSLTGPTGTVYAIQYSSNLFPTSTWVDRTLLQARDEGAVWSDPSAPAPGQRFYRAVSAFTPANPNLVF